MDSAIEVFSQAKGADIIYHVKQQRRSLKRELISLQMFMLILAERDQDGHLVPTGEARQDDLLRCGLLIADSRSRGLEETGGLFDDVVLLVNYMNEKKSEHPNLLEKIEMFRSEILENYDVFLNPSLKFSKPSASDLILIINIILVTLEDLATWKAEEIGPVNRQILALEERLKFFRNFIDFTARRCTERQKLEDFLIDIRAWAANIACLLYLFWINEMDENITSRLCIRLSALLQKIQPCTPEFTAMFLEVLIASKPPSDTFLMGGKLVVSFVDSLLENLAISLRDHSESLQEGLIFWITLLMDPPHDYEKQILARADSIRTETASHICSLFVEEMNEETANKRNILLFDFLEKINALKAEVRMFFIHIPNSFEFHILRNNGIGFIDSVLENTKKMLKCRSNFIPLAKHKVGIVQKELEYLRPFLKDIMEGQNEHEELKDLLTRIINVAYRAEYVIDLCSLMDCPIWHSLTCFSVVNGEIKLIKAEIENIQDKYMSNIKLLSAETNSMMLPATEASISRLGELIVAFEDEETTAIELLSAEMKSMKLLPTQATTSRINEVVVGFEDEATTIFNQLTGGSTRLEMICIVGMPGQGKTTLAKKVYYDSSVQYHFHKRAWSCVSQVYRCRDILLDILSDIIELNNCEISEISDEEIAERLRKCLMGQKYLIVLDDIWDIRAWNDIKSSFPDMNCGSRIVFTSRIHDLSWKHELKCAFHPLRPFSDEKTWELLHKKVFHNDESPQDLLQVGMKIAKDCKGLPLSIVVVAGLLAKVKNSLDWWKQIAESLSSRLSSEGCMDILELSYRHLPHYLKPCFLYFGVFAEDEEIRVQKLILLWIAEGFTQRTENKSPQDLAMEFLIDLVNRSLVTVVQRSSKGGIKACSVHSLLREFCLKKAKEENFLQLVCERDVQNDSFDPINYKQSRLCLDPGVLSSISAMPIFSSTHSLSFIGKFQRTFNINSCIFKIFRLLKVLDLSSIWLDSSFPEDITMLITHLRYLAISGRITNIPPSIAYLWNLETLIVKGEILHGVHLPETFWTMKSLRHVDVCELAYISFDANENQTAPLDIQTLSLVSLRHGRDTKILLRRLPRLRKLSCIYLHSEDRETNQYQLPVLSSLNELESLRVDYAGIVFEDGIITQDYFVRPFPALNFPESLRKLTLSKFRLSRRAMSTIGRLPVLEVLKLRKMAFEMFTWFVEEGQFLSLIFLEVSCSDIEEWNASTETFPNLQQLVLIDCNNLKAIPSSFANIYTLKMIKVRRCCFPVQNSARNILDEQRDLGNHDLALICL